jgi:hypothetical protein
MTWIKGRRWQLVALAIVLLTCAIYLVAIGAFGGITEVTTETGPIGP